VLSLGVAVDASLWLDDNWLLRGGGMYLGVLCGDDITMLRGNDNWSFLREPVETEENCADSAAEDFAVQVEIAL